MSGRIGALKITDFLSSSTPGTFSSQGKDLILLAMACCRECGIALILLAGQSGFEQASVSNGKMPASMKWSPVNIQT